MDYKYHYEKLIEKHGMKDRPLHLNNCERHHIIPKSMGGNNEESNLIYLTGRHHLVAHWLLYKIYNNKQMAMAFFIMSQNKSRYRVTDLEINLSKKAYLIHGDLMQEVKTPDGPFRSCRDAAAFYKIPESTMQDRIRNNPESYQWLSKNYMKAAKGGKHGMSRSIMTPIGEFETVGEAASHYEVTNRTILRYTEKYASRFYYTSPAKQGIRNIVSQNKRKVNTHVGVFESVASACAALGIERASLRYRIKSDGFPDYYYLD